MPRRMRLQQRLRGRVMRLLAYWNEGIWSDSRTVWWVNVLKTLNISVKSFLNKDLQTQACALTYRTTLAIVPALAMLFAIGRGFGFQKVLQDELFQIFPGQRSAIDASLIFVDSYLSHSSEGIFVGVGIAVLLWTLISLLSNVETTFNYIWGVRQGRSLWRKITDYTAMLLILPILMICASGLNIFLSTTLQNAFDFAFMTPVISVCFEVGSWLFTWLFFAGVFMLIPNTKVRFANAFIAGAVTGTAFKVLQWLFVSGQLYVTKYNAIYGSFSFLPLLLLWVQLTWMAVIIGALICYSSQNIFLFAFSAQISDISVSYRRKVTVAVAAIIVRRFVQGRPPVSEPQLVAETDIPPRLLSDVLDVLGRIKVINRVALDSKNEIFGFQPALEPSQITVGMLLRRIECLGRGGFIPHFSDKFPGILQAVNTLDSDTYAEASKILLQDFEINLSDDEDAR